MANLRSMLLVGSASLLALVAGAQTNSASAATLLYSMTQALWGNTNVTPSSSSPPESIAVTLLACIPDPINCNSGANGQNGLAPGLEPMVFLPSSTSQSINITGGTGFSTIASAFTSDTVNAVVAHRLLFDTVVPADFPEKAQHSIGPIYTGFSGAILTSIVVTIEPFLFQPQAFQGPEGGFVWVAQPSANRKIPPWLTHHESPYITFDFYASNLPDDWTPLSPPPPPPHQPPTPSEVPIPFALPMLVSGLGILGCIGWRQRKSATAT